MAQKITKMTPSICRQLNEEIREALAGIADKHGLTVTVNGGRRDPEVAYIPNLKFSIVSDGGIPADFKLQASKYGLTEDDYGKKVLLDNGNMAIITGINSRRPKYPISVSEEGSNRKFKMTASQVCLMLGKPSYDPFARTAEQLFGRNPDGSFKTHAGR